MKKLMLLAGLYCLQPALYANTIAISSSSHITPVSASDRAKAHFNANYSEARDAIWYSLPNKNLYCIFHNGKAVNRVFYDSRGNWQYTLMGYPGSSISKDVKDQVAYDFDGYHIVWVNEIQSSQNKPVYVINIENENHVKVIRVAGDIIEEQQAFTKGD